MTENPGNKSDFPTLNANTRCSRVPARLVLYFLSWSGFLVNFMIRNDINFAMVVMVKSKNATQTLLNATLVNQSDEKGDEWAEFDWDSKTTGMILSSFYWTYVTTQIIGGAATQRYGTKAVFGWAQLVTAFGTLCIPTAASTHWSLLVLVRAIQGFASGLTWPAMYAIVGPWIPTTERSRFMSSFQGFSIGIGLTYPLCGFIIANFGWRPVFYTTGSISILWCIMWYFLAFDTPKEHPRISQKELKYIEDNVSAGVKVGVKVPWKAIITSLPVWSIAISSFGRVWIHTTFFMQGPAFMKNILNFDIKSNGVMSGLPFLFAYLTSVVFCFIADILVKHETLSLTNIRKVMTAISQIVPAVLLLAVGFFETENRNTLIIWNIAVMLMTASNAGCMANVVDLAPNLAGPVIAFAQTILMCASFTSTMINGLILTDQKDLGQWQLSFLLSASLAIVTCFMFLVYSTSKIQSWNSPASDTSEVELQKLKPRS